MGKRIINFIALHQKQTLLVFFILAVAYPFIVTDVYFMRISVVALMFTSLTLSFNLLTGYLGQFSMAHCAFYGIGAYCVGILTRHLGNMSVLPAMLIGMLAAGAASLFLAVPTLRLKGFYFSVVTMGFSEIVKLIEINQISLTNGPLGIMNIPRLSLFGFSFTTPRQFYFLILFITVLFTYIIRAFLDSRMGRAVLAIREDEVAAQAMGIHAFKYKTMVFVLSTMMAGLTGGFYAIYTTYIDPSSFTGEISVRVMSMTLFGGLGSLPGSFVGAIALSVLPEITRGLSTYRYLIYGVIIVITMLFIPGGLMGKINFTYIRQRLCMRKEEGEVSDGGK